MEGQAHGMHRVASNVAYATEHALLTDPVDAGFESLRKSNSHYRPDGGEDEPAFPGTSGEKGCDDEESGKEAQEMEEDLLAQGQFDNGLTDQTSYLPTKQILLILLAVDLAVFLTFMEQTIVATALPVMASSFGSGNSQAWISSAYLMLSTGMLPMWGRLSDIIGRKYAILVCVGMFLLGSLLCAVAQSMIQLIFFRGVQGIGGGGMHSLSMVIVGDIVPLSSRGRYEGVIEGSIALANALGPVLGGIISQETTWRWCFWLNLPCGALTVITVIFAMPFRKVKGSAVEKLKNIDYGGSILIVGATTMLLLGLNWGGNSFSWKSGHVIGCIVGGIVGYISFLLWEWKAARLPVFPMYLFKMKTVSSVIVATFFQGMGYFATAYYVPQFFQTVRGKSPIMSGVLVLPLLLTTTVSVFIAGQIVYRTHQYKPLAVGGFCLWCIGLGLLSTINEDTSLAKTIGYQIIVGYGQGHTFQTQVIGLQASVERKDMSVATSMRNFQRLLGATISLVVCSVILNNQLHASLDGNADVRDLISVVIDNPSAMWDTVQQVHVSADVKDRLVRNREVILRAYVSGFQKLFYYLIGCIGLDIIVTTLFLGSHSLEREDDGKMKEKGKAWIEHRKKKGRSDDGAGTMENGEEQ